MSESAHDAASNFTGRRAQMVRNQLQARGITDAAVLQAMATVPRELFIQPRYAEWAYDDTPVPTLAKQTVSQPYVIAHMFSLLALQPTDRVLEVGTGSGYAAAVLSCIAAEVYTVERHQKLVEFARQKLTEGGFVNVWVKQGDGTLGWPEKSPYDAIVVAAGGPFVPASLKQQLALGGRLVMPVGTEQRHQHLVVVKHSEPDRFITIQETSVAFVPLIGAEGWPG